MRPSKLFTTAGIVSLVVGPVAVLVQYLFTPISGDLKTAALVEKAAQHHGAMRTALLLDIPAMLVIPAVLFVGYLVGSRTSTFAGVATGLCLVPAIGGVVLFANDAVVYEATKLADRPSAVAMVHGYMNNVMIGTVTAIYLITHVIGFIMLAVALRRQRVVPVWAVVALAVWPIVEMVGYGVDTKAVTAIAYCLLVAAYAACATALVRHDQPLGSTPHAPALGQNQPA
jgi:hypothetical protein